MEIPLADTGCANGDKSPIGDDATLSRGSSQMCAVLECDRPVYGGREFCPNHRNREQKKGPERYLPRLPQRLPCRMQGCDLPAQTDWTLCEEHREQVTGSGTCVFGAPEEPCGAPAAARGRCRIHEADAFADIREGVLERALDRIGSAIVVDDQGCWVPEGFAKDKDAYLKISLGKQTWRLHRLVRAALLPATNAPHLDHHCGNRACCHPMHLDPVPPDANQRRIGDRLKRPGDHWVVEGVKYSPMTFDLLRFADRHELPLQRQTIEHAMATVAEASATTASPASELT